jgi:hypothetical protein
VRQVAHGFQEDLLQGVAAVRELPHEQVLRRRECPDGLDLNSCRQDDTPAPAAFRDALGADPRQRRPQGPIVPSHFQLDEAPVRAPLLFEIALVHDRAVLQNHGLVAHLLDVAEQMGADEHVHPLLLLHVGDELEHAPTRRRIEAVCRFVQHDQLRPVDDGLGELGHLLHPVRIGSQFPVARLAEPDVEQGLVRLLERRARRKARQLGHLTQEGDPRHLRDERVVLRHVADSRPGATHVVSTVQTQNAGASSAGPEKPEERQDQRGLAGPVGPQQPHRFSCTRNAETAGDPVQDLPPSQVDLQVVEFDDGCAVQISIVVLSSRGSDPGAASRP